MFDYLLCTCLCMAARQALQDQENCLLFVDKRGKKRSKKEVNARMALALTYADYRAGVQRKLSSLHKDVYITSTWTHYDQ